MSGFGGLSPVDYTGLQTQADPLAGFAQGYAQTAAVLLSILSIGPDHGLRY